MSCARRVLCLPHGFAAAGQLPEKVQDLGPPSKASPKGSISSRKQRLEHRGWACHMTADALSFSRPSPGLLQPCHPRFQLEKLSPDPVGPTCNELDSLSGSWQDGRNISREPIAHTTVLGTQRDSARGCLAGPNTTGPPAGPDVPSGPLHVILSLQAAS